MGRSVVLCDVDGDGQDDMVVGAPQSSSNRGEVGVWFGSESAS
ncbi:MAG: FG-GAP repeat protein, partial [bacterium]